MDDIQETIQKEFRGYVAQAVKDGLSQVEPRLSKKSWFGGYDRWPSLSFHKNGLPSFYISTLSAGSRDYKKEFDKGKYSIDPTSIESFRTLSKFVQAYTYLQERILPIPINSETSTAVVSEFIEVSIYQIPEELIDRYIHVHETCIYSDDAFSKVYEPYARSIFQEKLYIDLHIPILFIKFDFEETAVAPNVMIERMSDDFQLARATVKSHTPSVHDSVLSAATHSLVLKNWHFQNENWLQRSKLISDSNAYPLDKINEFFAAIRIVTGLDTGYAQLLMCPQDWASTYKATLPPIEGTSTKAYPDWFENYYWINEDIPAIDEDTIKRIGFVYAQISEAKENSIHIAIRKLNNCLLRSDEQDLVIDATIALEALLSDGSNQEMTHKLAMRIGALANSSEVFEKTANEVFKEVKRIYGYRSAIVHGSTEAHKKREIVSKDNKRMLASSLAVDYLRKVLQILLEEPRYRKASTIDEELLLGGKPN